MLSVFSVPVNVLAMIIQQNPVAGIQLAGSTPFCFMAVTIIPGNFAHFMIIGQTQTVTFLCGNSDYIFCCGFKKAFTAGFMYLTINQYIDLLAKDGANLSAAQQTTREARQPVSMGETYDFTFTPTPGQRLWLNLVRGSGE